MSVDKKKRIMPWLVLSFLTGFLSFSHTLVAQIPSQDVIGTDPHAFKWGISRLLTWLGNVALPILAGLFVAAGALSVSHDTDQAFRLFTAAFLSFIVAGLVRLFDTQLAAGTFNHPNGYAIALVRLVNYVGNVILPLYAALQIGLMIFKVSPHGYNMTGKYDFAPNLITAALCLMVAGLTRLIETLVRRALG